jgi:hypothetical protein
MNRQTGRAAKAMARHTSKSKYNEIVAVHEAGHAVAKVMAARDFGYDVHEAVTYIDVGSQEPGLTPDGEMIVGSHGITLRANLFQGDYARGCWVSRWVLCRPRIPYNEKTTTAVNFVAELRTLVERLEQTSRRGFWSGRLTPWQAM